MGKTRAGKMSHLKTCLCCASCEYGTKADVGVVFEMAKKIRSRTKPDSQSGRGCRSSSENSERETSCILC
jgi:hypothetical protein